MVTARLEDWQSIKTLVLMTIGTNRGTWWADPDFGSDLWVLRQTEKASPATVVAVEQEIDRCLRWLTADGLVSRITVSAEQRGRTRIDYKVVVHQPQGGEATIEGVWNGIG